MNAAPERCRGDEARPVRELRHVSHRGGRSPASLAWTWLARGRLAWQLGSRYLGTFGVQSGRPPPSPVGFARQDPCPPCRTHFAKFHSSSTRPQIATSTLNPRQPSKNPLSKNQTKWPRKSATSRRYETTTGDQILCPIWLTNGNDSSSRSAGGRMPPVCNNRNRRQKHEPLGTNVNLTALIFFCSRPDQEEQEDLPDQVQGPMLQAPVHAGPEGRREGREAQAVAAPQYDSPTTRGREERNRLTHPTQTCRSRRSPSVRRRSSPHKSVA